MQRLIVMSFEMNKTFFYTRTVLVRADKIPFNHHNLKYFSLARNMCSSSFCCSFKRSVEGSVGVSVWGLEDGDLLGLVINWGLLHLNESLGSWPRVGGGCLGGGGSDVTAGLVWSSGGWVGVVVWDSIWLIFSAWGS